MDKLLAMSILSSGPDFFGDRKANGWFDGGWIGKKNKEEENKGGSDESRTLPVPAKKLEQQQKSKSVARFAVELDGLHCFETIIPQ
ncbi:hypothetical protein COCNU_07G001830 [Cocos nucifera]|uniref:Uncharacterized protein n=1 Tax=Cocos nucifera TaxID=13894 RepID=A0A8K0IDX8_COCNU|nr:hypothetical protein COCNU_07G001830 [Cocos nucifera]